MSLEKLAAVPRLKQTKRPICTIVLASDENYVAPAGVTIYSLLQTVSQNVFCDVVILDNGISENSRQKLQRLFENSEHAELRFVDTKQIISQTVVHAYFTQANYLPVFVPWLFRDHERVLYIDCDMIVQKDISVLFEDRICG